MSRTYRMSNRYWGKKVREIGCDCNLCKMQNLLKRKYMRSYRRFSKVYISKYLDYPCKCEHHNHDYRI